MTDILKDFAFSAIVYQEEDDSITLSLNEIDLVENGSDLNEAKLRLCRSIHDYAMEYYSNYALYSQSPNRREHIPYIFKVLLMDDPQRIGDSIVCQNEKENIHL